MSRPAPIAALDAALEQHLAALADAEIEQSRVHDEHDAAIREIEAVHTAAAEATKAAQKARADAYYAAKSCEGAIRKLGYVVLDGSRTVAPDASRLDGHDGNFAKPLYTENATPTTNPAAAATRAELTAEQED